MNRRLGVTLGVLIVASAAIELAVLAWYVATHDLAPRSLRIYVLGLGLPVLIMLAIGGVILRWSDISSRPRLDG